jgi:transposase
MTARRDLSLEEKINLIKEKESGLSHQQLSDRFKVSVGAVSNILKRELEYTNDFESNRNKKIKRKLKDDSS